MGLTHWRRLDRRKDILELTLSGIEQSLHQLKTRLDENDWYDGSFLLEDAEPIIGLAYITYQNYIVSSVYDRFGNIQGISEYYKKGSALIKGKRTEIELIIALANYYKHRDNEKDLHDRTKSVLVDLDLNYLDIIEPENLPILKGMDFLSSTWNLNDITEKVTQWREALWENYTHNNN